MFINWTTPARRDLKEIATYIRKDNPSAAQAVAGRLFSSIEALTTFPNRGRAGRVRDTRELVLAPLPYIAVYSVLRDEIRILRIRHTSQDWP